MSRSAGQPADVGAALDGAADQARLLQSLDVLGRRGQRHVEGRRELAHRALALGQTAQHPATRGVSQGVEDGVKLGGL